MPNPVPSPREEGEVLCRRLAGALRPGRIEWMIAYDQSSVLLPCVLIEQCESPEVMETYSADGSPAQIGELFVGIDLAGSRI
jgi:hypothetical protein